MTVEAYATLAILVGLFGFLIKEIQSFSKFIK